MIIGSQQKLGRPVFRSRVLALALGLGALDILLFFLLFHFASQLKTLTDLARQGMEIYALVPLIIIMPMAIVHGTFIDYLWDLLGLRVQNKGA